MQETPEYLVVARDVRAAIEGDLLTLGVLPRLPARLPGLGLPDDGPKAGLALKESLRSGNWATSCMCMGTSDNSSSHDCTQPCKTGATALDHDDVPLPYNMFSDNTQNVCETEFCLLIVKIGMDTKVLS